MPRYQYGLRSLLFDFPQPEEFMRFTSRHGVRRRGLPIAATALFALVSACGDNASTASVASTTEQVATTIAGETTTTEAATNTLEPGPSATDAPGSNELQPPSTATTPANPSAAGATNCLISLHGKGGNGSATKVSGNVVHIFPTGNGTGWGGRQWSYASNAEFAAARTTVADAASSARCTRVVINGFSNGGAFAAKLYCRGESLGGTLAGIVVDDPVPDHGTAGCSPAPGVRVALYWTGGLDDPAQPGWNCSEQDWTCEGGTTVGINAYAAAMRTNAKASPHSSHQRYENPPEHAAWLGV